MTTNLQAAARAIAYQRDYRAEFGACDPHEPHPADDEGFDDWAADALDTALAADAVATRPLALADMSEAEQARAIDDMARRLVEQEVRYCVSGLVSALCAVEVRVDAIDLDDLTAICWRQPDADDYREADTCALVIEQAAEGSWNWGEGDITDGTESTELDAWRAAFDATGQDYPDGTECLEHWLVTDDLARRLREQGEAVADDIAGMTVWGRCTSGQVIYADAVIQRIARDILEA